MHNKARRVKIRKTWSINPKPRVKQSRKQYCRKNKKKG